jgi:hypothetical protein
LGVSIYYTARRKEPLLVAERSAIDADIARFPLAALLQKCGVAEVEFDGEDFCVYPTDARTEPGVVFEGATKLPLCSEDAMWAAVQYWCRLLSAIRQDLKGAKWDVRVDDHDIPWVEKSREFDPAG